MRVFKKQSEFLYKYYQIRLSNSLFYTKRARLDNLKKKYPIDFNELCTYNNLRH